MFSPPNDVRHFVHKKLFGAAKGFISSGFNPLGAVGGFLGAGKTSGRQGGAPTAPRAIRADFPSQKAFQIARNVGQQFPVSQISLPFGLCPPPLKRDSDGECRFPGSPADISVGGAMQGEAVMGRYGAALTPDVEMRRHRGCLPGMVLGKDGLCYNRRDLKNSEREYPRGTRPLGTPGEMACLRKAASFGRRMETTVKRMQKIGVLKKPATRKATRAPKMLTDGVRVVNVE